ncbi:MAG: MFS transporter [Desulfobacterales bacterium]|nr:MFS transporter [Desulfobacterales bacterium]
MSLESPIESELRLSLFARMHQRVSQFLSIAPGEGRVLVYSFSYFFCLLCSYYIIRPMRDEMGIAGGVEKLQWMFTGTFLVMLAAVPLFGWLVRRFPVQRFLPCVYFFFIGNLFLFYIVFKFDVHHAYVARIFFIWASVYNLFIVSVFWSFMADSFSTEQARRLFGIIAAGGTAGALTGPALTAVLVMVLGPTNLLLISAAFLLIAVGCIYGIIAWKQSAKTKSSANNEGAAALPEGGMDQRIGGSIFAGIRRVFQSSYLLGICLLMLLFTTLSTFLYFQQAQIISNSFQNPADRTAIFAGMDFAVNALTLTTQMFITSRIINKLGLSWTLALVPIFLGFGFLALGWMPTLAVLVAVQVMRRAGNYAIMRPAREMLYVVVDKEEKYKAKNFIDTVVYRGGDAMSAWAYAGMKALGLGMAGIAFTAVPLAAAWALISFKLGKSQMQRAARRDQTSTHRKDKRR